MREDIDLLVRLHYMPPAGDHEDDWAGGWVATAEVLGGGADLAKYRAVDDSPRHAALVAVRERVRAEED